MEVGALVVVEALGDKEVVVEALGDKEADQKVVVV